MDPIRALIADDHATVLAGVRELLVAAGCEVVGEASDAESTLTAVRALEPTLVVLDLGMPGSGVKVIEGILKARPETKILAFTMHAEGVYLRAALNAGAHGYLTKSASSADFKRAVKAVVAGRMYIDRAFGLVDGEPPARRVALSAREAEVLRMLAEGYTQREIADSLQLSARTVETFRARLSEKLQLRSRVDLVRYAIETGVLQATSEADGNGDS